MSTRNALVTGGTGFVGSNLCRRLFNDGWSVHVIAIQNDNFSQLQDLLDAVTIHVHDGTTESMVNIVTAAKPKVVFHLASLFLSEHVVDDISRLITSNVLFGAQLLEAMTASGISEIVNTGTSWQHYENKPYSPVNLYAATKQAFEDILQYYVEAKHISAITLKLFDTYGPNDPRPKLFHLLNRVATENIPLAMSPGEQLIDLVHIDDVINAFAIAAQHLLRAEVIGHEIYGVSSGNPISLKELVALYEQVVGGKISIEWGGREYRYREVMVPCSDLRTIYGWIPAIDLKNGIHNIASCRII